MNSLCTLYRELDAKYNTDKTSPLHHDNRCPKCGPTTKENKMKDADHVNDPQGVKNE